MKILDTDTLTLFFTGHPKVTERRSRETDIVVITIINQIETLQGRYATLLKATDGAQLQVGQQRLERAENDLSRFPQLPINAAAAAEFDRLRENKKLKKIGRNDLLIASIALAHRATVVTRNLKDFRQVPGLKVENWAD